MPDAVTLRSTHVSPQIIQVNLTTLHDSGRLKAVSWR